MKLLESLLATARGVGLVSLGAVRVLGWVALGLVLFYAFAIGTAWEWLHDVGAGAKGS